jgi:Ran GTPase-activating protein (RanGAP) involved in mRNA processing and transport
MFMLPEDHKQVAAIEGRRRFEEERKLRIFNARQRLIGVSKVKVILALQFYYKTYTKCRRLTAFSISVNFFHKSSLTEKMFLKNCLNICTSQIHFPYMNMFAAHNKDEIIHKNPRSWNLFSRDSYV